jgi:hypothetical protein
MAHALCEPDIWGRIDKLSNYLTNWLHEACPSSESEPVKKFPAFYGTRRYITALIKAHHLSLSWSRSIQSMPPHTTSWRSVLIIIIMYCNHNFSVTYWAKFCIVDRSAARASCLWKCDIQMVYVHMKDFQNVDTHKLRQTYCISSWTNRNQKASNAENYSLFIDTWL